MNNARQKKTWNFEFAILIRMQIARGLAGLGLVLFVSASVGAAGNEATILRLISVDTAVNWAQVDCFVQTPSGGEPGTSDIRRPNSDELGIHDILFYEFGLRGIFDKAIIYGGAHWIQLSNEGVLEKPLVTRMSFPAGTQFDVSVKFDWYQLGVSRLYGRQGSIVRWLPKAEVALLTFDYEFGNNIQCVSRSYSRLAVRMGVNVYFQLGGNTTIAVTADGSLPSLNVPEITSCRLLFCRSLSKLSRRWETAVFAGAGWMYINYEDSQQLPNRVRFEALPYNTAGLTINF